MISEEAKKISTEFAKLREKGFWVYNFNTQKPMKYGSTKKFCDLLVIGENGVHFIEVKLESTKDTEKPIQKLFRLCIERLEKLTPYITYWKIHSLKDAQSKMNVFKLKMLI